MKWKADRGLQARMGLTMILLIALYVVFIGVLAYMGVGTFMLILIMAVFMGGQVFFSDKLALRSMGAHEVSEEEYPELHATVGRLAQQADLPKPTIAVANSRVPNAFATGRSPWIAQRSDAARRGLVKSEYGRSLPEGASRSTRWIA